MDGPWQEVIYNLSLPCVSVRQLRQREIRRDGDRDRRTSTEQSDRKKQKNRGSSFFFRLSFREIFHLFSAVFQHDSTSQGYH